MKSLFLVLALSVSVIANSSENSDEKFQKFSEYEKKIIENIQVIDLILKNYEYEGSEYTMSWNYHIGFLNGKYAAFYESLNILKDN